MTRYDTCLVIDGEVMCRTEPKPSRFPGPDGKPEVWPEQHSTVCIAARLRLVGQASDEATLHARYECSAPGPGPCHALEPFENGGGEGQ